MNANDSNLWRKEATCYQICPLSLLDSSDDAYEDLAGVSRKLDWTANSSEPVRQPLAPPTPTAFFLGPLLLCFRFFRPTAREAVVVIADPFR